MKIIGEAREFEIDFGGTAPSIANQLRKLGIIKYNPEFLIVLEEARFSLLNMQALGIATEKQVNRIFERMVDAISVHLNVESIKDSE